LEDQLDEARRVDDPTAAPSRATGKWSAFRGGRREDLAGGAGGTDADPETGIPEERLAALLRKAVDLPADFVAHPVIARLRQARLAMALGARPLDWSAAEALAFATLVTDGHPVRLSGQDSQRGTFGHRHAVLHDQQSGATCCPLARLDPAQAPFRVFNSPLSEAAVLGFDWGYSLERPDGLTIWEAQFGDFANGAQVIIDQFIASAEQKWGLLSGLCLLLPHGFDGQGPEHSSARLERFLSLVARENMQVVSPSTASQLFHCLRRQVLSAWRKPLVMMSPKGLLRHPAASSALSEFVTGRFRAVLDDAAVPISTASRVLVCSGKVAHELVRERSGGASPESAASIVRVEQLHPFPAMELRALLAAAPPDCAFAWVQEEPENMGAWPDLRNRLPPLLPAGAEIQVVARVASASPATGSKARHEAEQADLLRRALRCGTLPRAWRREP
jgi:2-oxoglutarate dehydrogenase E1 component